MGRKGQVAWNKGLKGYLVGHPCYTKDRPPWNKGLTKGTDDREAVAAQKMRDAHQRRISEIGDTSGICGKHDRIRRRNGRPRICENCGTTEAKFFDWVCLDHKYDSENIESWARLCRRCHTHYDCGKITIRGLRITERGGKLRETGLKPLFGENNPSKRLDVRAKIAAANTGKKASPETRKRLSLAHMGKMVGDDNPARRPDVRAKIALTKWSKRHSTCTELT